jgi:hypothetical protein
LLKKRKEDETAAKPTFVSKKDREAAAMARRAEEVNEQRRKNEVETPYKFNPV